MRLAKQHIDIGMFTTDIDVHTKFWGETVGLRLDHKLDFGNGTFQHRYDAHDSVIKVNHYPYKFAPQPPSGFVGLTIARANKPEWTGTCPGGGETVRLVPPGTDDVVGIGITVSSPDPARMIAFYVDALEFEAVNERTARCGDSVLFFVKGPGAKPTKEFVGPNFRYLTIQIYDADQACADVVKRGGRIGLEPVSFAKVARYGFVLDPDGNWIEMSARTSLTGIEVK